ncbi:tRNA U34 5-methylaminomethyl-2-thiouridine-forming methyltransferase MnmC [Catalinimonas alkaloidigena]|uniref:tRNA U34 5-methylaminomethyl-2-thiouridine-forming methyltransferase MnmC n=1 Tax=Catalinimonas alkaloidigena TaxID=1075417 RepID=A0A1G9MMY1_9BACT|nr:tRNA (5-methylaminomethyl-2-thiouridine)(34)-methyltransferase MnmD [Catalinimonas alkaloidigena]SDL75015.1 tRNA U34 5-methylaminomethyl-2-thiouridine-forming methyltransferase MnmC [Catalinimonas alkaloidigena]
MPDSPLQLITTGDGSPSLYHTELDETYHSRRGAVTESDYVFIQRGLVPATEVSDPVRVFEVGFGTGLNALLTLRYAEEHQQAVVYHTIELYPLAPSLWQALTFPPPLDQPTDRQWFRQLHESPWGQALLLTPHFTFQKIEGDIHTYPSATAAYDVVYFDAFAPQKQPDCWQPDVFHRLYTMLRADGALITYCAQGAFRRTLQATGFKVEKLPGPPGKREMVRAWKV